MNNGKLNSLMTVIFEKVGKYAPRYVYEEWYREAIYLRKITKDCDYVDNIMTICCSDGNLDITTDCGYSTKQFVCARAIEKLQYRKLTIAEVNGVINSI